MSDVERGAAIWSQGGGWIVLILVGLAGGGYFGMRSGEADAVLESDIASILATASDDLDVEVSWGRVTLSGSVSSRQLQESILREVTSLPGVRQVADRTEIVAPLLGQPRLSLVFMEDGRLTIEGVLAHAEKNAWGDALASLARIAYANLSGAEQMVALGGPETLSSALGGIGSVPGLEIELTSGRILLEGELADAEIQQVLLEAIRGAFQQEEDEWAIVNRTRFREPRQGIADEEEALARLLEGLRIEFDEGTYQLTAKSHLPIDRMAAFLKSHPHLRLEIAAVDEPSRPGSGKRRADSIYFAFMKRGISSLSLMSRRLETDVPETGVARFRVLAR